MKKVFITGITGLLGANLLQSFLYDGVQVTGLVRQRSKYKGPVHPLLTLAEGDLFSDLTGYMHDVDAVIHAAAETNQSLLNYSEYARINLNGTLLLYLTASHCKVKKFIFISSANTLGFGTAEEPGTENSPLKSPFDKSFYARSKTEAEQYLLNNETQTRVIILNPAFMLGDLDYKPSSGKIIKMGLQKRVVFCPPGGKNFVHVLDVADAAKKCIELDLNTQRFIIANENMNYRKFFRKLAELTNQKTTIITLPASVMIFMGYLGSFIRFFGIRSSLSLVNMRILSIENFYSNEKSKRMLGMKYRPVDQAIMDSVACIKNLHNQLANYNNLKK